ncbi:MAG: PorT family protein [Chitinophagales bacterium]|nr:PorT family protein [Chitinophagales bacterium]
MKKYFLITIIIVANLPVFSQRGFHLGASGAFNFNMIFPQHNYRTLAPFAEPFVRTSEMDYKATWGGNGGICLGYGFHKNWSIQLEAQYNSTGQKYEDNFVGPATIPQGIFGVGGDRVNVKRNVRLSYVQIPLMAKFVSTKGYVAKAFVTFGPQFGIRTTAKEEIYIADNLYADTLFSANEKFNSFDMGFAIQGGVELYANDNLYFDLGLSVYQGFLDINTKKVRYWYSQNDSDYTSSYNFRVGILAGVHYIFGDGRSDY